MQGLQSSWDRLGARAFSVAPGAQGAEMPAAVPPSEVPGLGSGKHPPAAASRRLAKRFVRMLSKRYRLAVVRLLQPMMRCASWQSIATRYEGGGMRYEVFPHSSYLIPFTSYGLLKRRWHDRRLLQNISGAL